MRKQPWALCASINKELDILRVGDGGREREGKKGKGGERRNGP